MAKRKPDAIDETLSEVLRSAIIESGLSNYRVCKETGVNQATLSRFMNKTHSMSLDNADKICKLLELKLKK
jgi:hypothetical protein